MNLEDNMEELLNMDVEHVEKPNLPKVKSKEDDQQKDYEYTRGELYSLIDQGQEAVKGALEVAQESGHPRAYEVVFQGAKAAADVVDKIADLHKKMKDLEVEEVKVQQHNTTNNVFMSGSTQDIIKMLKENKDK